MAEMGFLPEITSILDLIPEGGQRLLFSATLDRGVDDLVKRYLNDAVTHSTDDATAIGHDDGPPRPAHRPAAQEVITAEVANREGRTLVFVPHQARRRPRRLAAARAGRLRRRAARWPEPGRTQPRPRRLPGRHPAGARRDRRRRPRHPRRRRVGRPPGRPAGRPQGLPAPLRPHGSRRRQRAPSSRSPSRTSGAPWSDSSRRRRRRRRRSRRSPATPSSPTTGGRLTPSVWPSPRAYFRRLLAARGAPPRRGRPRGPRGPTRRPGPPRRWPRGRRADRRGGDDRRGRRGDRGEAS